MFDLNHWEAAELRLPLGTENGVPLFRKIMVQGIMLWSEEAFPEFPSKNGGKGELLLKSSVPPEPGSRVRWRKKMWEIRKIRICRDLDGNVIGYRCTLA